ncbi:hypothetical protein K8S19_08610 [bacterium]|nr:hypothetical protein [bacterium]
MRKIILSALLVILAASPVLGMQFQSGENIYYDRGDLLDEDFYIAAEQVDFSGNALQDLFVAASSKAAIAGTVVQDLNVAVVEGEINAKVGDDLHVLAKHIILSGRVGGSALVLASEIYVKPQSVFEADSWFLGGSVHFSGTANDRMRISANTVMLDGTVAGDLLIEAGSIIIGRKARILGRLEYTAEKEIHIEQGAHVQNRPVWKKNTGEDQDDVSAGLKNFFTFGKVVYRLTIYIGLLVLGCILILLLPQPARRYAMVMRYQFWSSLGWGVLTALGILVGLIIFIITIIGIPLAIVLGITSFAAWMATAIGMGYLLGVLVLKPAPDKMKANIGAFVLGFTALFLVELIPVVGALISLVVLFAGLGALWLAKNFVEPKVVMKVQPKKAAVKPEPVLQSEIPVVPKAVTKKKSAVKHPEWKPAVPAFQKTPRLVSKKKAASKKPAAKKVKQTTTKKTVSKKQVVKKNTGVKKQVIKQRVLKTRKKK